MTAPRPCAAPADPSSVNPNASTFDPAAAPAPRVAVWWAPLELAGPALRTVTSCLSAEERRHASRLHRPRDRMRFEAARGWRRRLLARQRGCAPADVAIVTDDPRNQRGPDVVNGDGDRTGFSVVETGTDQTRADAGHHDNATLAGYVSPT